MLRTTPLALSRWVDMSKFFFIGKKKYILNMFSFYQSNIYLSTHTNKPKKIKLRDHTKYSSGPQMNNKFHCFGFLLCKAFSSLYSIAGKAIIISPWPLHFSVYRPVFLQGAQLN
jgi:hypothetical protein